MVRDFCLGCAWAIVLACSSESPGLDSGVSDALIGPDIPTDVSQDSPGADAGQDGASPADSGPDAVLCGNFMGILPDANIPVPCTGSNWQWESVQLVPQGPCSQMVCPLNNGFHCVENGRQGYVICH